MPAPQCAGADGASRSRHSGPGAADAHCARRAGGNAQRSALPAIWSSRCASPRWSTRLIAVPRAMRRRQTACAATVTACRAIANRRRRSPIAPTAAIVRAASAERRISIRRRSPRPSWKTIPPPPAAPARRSSRAQAAGEGLRILLAEDNPINMLLIRELLRRRGHSVTEVTTGTAAVKAMAGRPLRSSAHRHPHARHGRHRSGARHPRRRGRARAAPARPSWR